MKAVVVLLALAIALPAAAQVQIVDIIPPSMTDETDSNAEPFVAVDPTNPQRMAVAAFTHAQSNSNLGPVYLTTDGGMTWAPKPILPTCNGCWNANDETLGFAPSSSDPNHVDLFAGILKNPGGFTFTALRSFDMSLGTPMVTLESRFGPDQPWVQTRGVVGWTDSGQERLYIGINDGGHDPASATIDQALAAGNPAPPAFTTNRLDAGPVMDQDEPEIRPVSTADGHVYALFYRRLTQVFVTGYTADVVLVRDDNWGKGNTPYTDLIDSGSNPPLAGQRIVAGVTVTDDFNCGAWCDSEKIFPGQRISGDLSIAVDPNDWHTVYVMWADRQPKDPMTLHVQMSTDGGQTWPGPDLITIPSAKNGALAVNSQGRLAFAYQQWTGTKPNHHWQTHLRRLVAGNWTDDLLSDEPCEWIDINVTDCEWTGDFGDLKHAGKNFYGTFSTGNDPTTLAPGTIYLRNHDNATPPHLLDSSNSPLAFSVDPFFFRTTELAAGDDFYVRDWTDSFSTYDHGLEPSTHPDFFSFSDVWNERTNDPLAFDANNRPQSHDPQPMSKGPNYAFTRISREAGGGANDVSVHFFFSDGGVGIPYQDAGSTTVHFNAGQTQVTIPAGSGVQWNLPSGMSNHVCLAVQIETANDPFLPLSLLNRAPGWPGGTDLAILNDNNKAQRNMQVFGYGGKKGPMMMAAIVHNAARVVRDVVIGVDLDPEIERIVANGTVTATGRDPSPQPLRQHSTVTFPAMRPGEDRWIIFRGDLRELPSGEAAIRIYELNGEEILNGYAFHIRQMDDAAVAAANAFQQEVVFLRARALFGSEATTLQRLVAELLARDGGSDPFGLQSALNDYANATDAERPTALLSLLNAIDANETMLRRRVS